MLKTKFKVYTTQKIRLCAKHRQTDKGLTPDVKFITDHNCTVKKDKKQHVVVLFGGLKKSVKVTANVSAAAEAKAPRKEVN